ncbi:MAG TPA: hypothetical protein VLL08_08120 [Kineosporiaceae bacterium]|nr:hypothetical protein [Kineosporiaceae bacterium]
MHRWDPLNERQLDVLTRIAAGEDLGAPEHSSLRASANAVRNRGLLAISKRGGVWRAEVTGAGQYYLEHGHHPDHPLHGLADAAEARSDAQLRGHRGGRPDTRSKRPEPSSARPRGERSASPAGPTLIERRQAAAEELVARLVAERRVIVSAPTEAEATYWRQIVDFAKRRSLVPEGHRIEKQKLYNRAGDLQISLRHGLHANSHVVLDGVPRVAVPDQLRAPHPVVAALRDDPGRLVMPKELRRRSLLIFQGLAAEATRRGYVVRPEPVREERRSY